MIPKRVFTLAVASLLALTIGSLRAGESDFANYFPKTLTDAAGGEVSRDVLKGKMVGIYFSAKWCPPCRAFTPGLVKFRDDNQKDIEIVFVSSDRSTEAQRDYMTSYGMKWPPTENQSSDSAKLADMFKVRGIPALIIIGADGKLVTADGRMDLHENPDAALAKWKKGAPPKTTAPADQP